MLFMVLFVCVYFFFFKQKTAYEMRISDWSSDVCSSDLSSRVEGGCIASDMADLLMMRSWRLLRQTRRRPPSACGLHCRRRMAQGGQIGRASCRERVCQYV